MRIVFDTNILISAIGWGGQPAIVLEKCIEKKAMLVLSEDIFSEVREVLSRDKFKGISKKAKDDFILFLREISLIVNPEISFDVCRDKKDNMFIEAAIKGKARYIVSGDDDLLSLRSFHGIEIITVSEMLNVFSGQNNKYL
jgi:putative PIN family toxin of toxin-antitoxin system